LVFFTLGRVLHDAVIHTLSTVSRYERYKRLGISDCHRCFHSVGVLPKYYPFVFAYTSTFLYKFKHIFNDKMNTSRTYKSQRIANLKISVIYIICFFFTDFTIQSIVMNNDPGIICFKHCNDKNIYCINIPTSCPICKKCLENSISVPIRYNKNILFK